MLKIKILDGFPREKVTEEPNFPIGKHLISLKRIKRTQGRLLIKEIINKR